MRKIAVPLLILLLLCGVAYQIEVYPPLPAPERLVPATCELVVDGDTAWFQVVENGVEVTHKVRFLLVDTPETVHPNKPVEPGGPEASAYVREVLEGQEVWLEYDLQRTDHYGRQLCHIWLADGSLLNLRLLELGYGKLSIYPPNIRYQKFFVAAAQYAKQNKLGIWAETAP